MAKVKLIPSLPSDPEDSLRILYPNGVEAFLTGVTVQEVINLKHYTGQTNEIDDTKLPIYEPVQVKFSYDYTALENINDNNYN